MKQFPKNFRFIPEAYRTMLRRAFANTFFWSLFLIVVVLSAMAIIVRDIAQNKADISHMQLQRLEKEKEVIAWQKRLAVYPEYRDGYYKLAEVYYELGNKKKAVEALNQSLSIDPEFSAAKLLLSEVTR